MLTLSAERWREISPYLDEALSLDDNQRASWLEIFGAKRPDLVEVVRGLLREHLQLRREQFLDRGPAPIVEESTLAGQTIGAYRFISLIGQGGMGTVWLAERCDGHFERHVAIKFLHLSVATQGGIERFKREGRILAQLTHPNVAELLDAGITPNREPYLVLEYVDGEPIIGYCDRQKLDINDRIRLFLDVLGAVAHAHANLIVHRDLKPSNVMVRKDSCVKLLDFGIAKLLADDGTPAPATLLTLEAGGALTPLFAAPEQISGGKITTATDIYALGLLLYLLLTGHHPLGKGQRSPAEWMKAVVDTDPPRPSQIIRTSDLNDVATRRTTAPEKLSRQLRGDLDTIIAKALKKNAAERYQSVTAFADDLRRYLKHEPISAHPESLLYRSNKFILRNKLGVAIVALTLLGATIALTTIEREARRAEYRFQQVRKLAHSVLFDLNPQIELLAGSTKAREQLVKTSLEYLDSLSSEAGNDSRLQLELAEAYIKVGDVQGNPNYANLGQPVAALESYAKAIAIANKLGNSAEGLETLATAYSDTGTVQASQMGTRSAGRENLRLAASIADSIPKLTGKPAYRLRLLAYGFLGDADKLYDADRAAEPLHRCLEIAREWVQVDPGREPRFLLAVATREWSDILWYRGDLKAARESLLQSAAMFHEVLTEDPNNGDWVREQHVAEEEIGVVSGDPDYFNLRDTESAVEWLQKDVEGYKYLLSADSNDVRARFGLSEALAELGAVYRESDPRRAEGLYHRSFSLSNSVLQSNPQDSETLYWQSFERIGFASDLELLGKHAAAMAELRQAINVLEDSGNRDSTEFYFRSLLGRALHRRAAYAVRVGNQAQAAKDLQKSEQTLRPLFQQNPRNLRVLNDLADCYREQGNLAVSRRNWHEAAVAYRKSLELWDRWRVIGTSTIYDQRQRRLVASLLHTAEIRSK